MSFITLDKDYIEKNTSRTPLRMSVEASQILDYATLVLVDFFGKERAFHIKPLFLKNRTLTLACSNSALAQEIRQNQIEILEKINEKIGKKEVDCLRYLA